MADKDNKWEKRDKARQKARYGHTVGSKSVFVIQELAVLEAERIAARNKKKKDKK
jgi:hypothetical protein